MLYDWLPSDASIADLAQLVKEKKVIVHLSFSHYTWKVSIYNRKPVGIIVEGNTLVGALDNAFSKLDEQEE